VRERERGPERLGLTRVRDRERERERESERERERERGPARLGWTRIERLRGMSKGRRL